jgi:hypothetical protein
VAPAQLDPTVLYARDVGRVAIDAGAELFLRGALAGVAFGALARVFVKPNRLLGRAYTASIGPFRDIVAYPALL